KRASSTSKTTRASARRRVRTTPPDHIVEYIVENAVGPVVVEKFEAMRPSLREAEQWHRQRIKSANAKGENPKKYESGPAVDNQWYKLVNALFDIKVLDPAMGSG